MVFHACSLGSVNQIFGEIHCLPCICNVNVGDMFLRTCRGHAVDDTDIIQELAVAISCLCFCCIPVIQGLNKHSCGGVCVRACVCVIPQVPSKN